MNPEVDLKELLYNTIWPKVGKIVETICQGDASGYRELMGLEAEERVENFEDLKIMCEMMKSDYLEGKPDVDKNWDIMVKNIFQIPMLATETAKLGSVVAANLKFST